MERFQRSFCCSFGFTWFAQNDCSAKPFCKLWDKNKKSGETFFFLALSASACEAVLGKPTQTAEKIELDLKKMNCTPSRKHVQSENIQ